MAGQRIVICGEGHLFRTAAVTGSAGDHATVRCPVCRRPATVRLVDARMLSQEALAEAWRHTADRR